MRFYALFQNYILCYLIILAFSSYLHAGTNNEIVVNNEIFHCKQWDLPFFNFKFFFILWHSTIKIILESQIHDCVKVIFPVLCKKVFRIFITQNTSRSEETNGTDLERINSFFERALSESKRWVCMCIILYFHKTKKQLSCNDILSGADLSTFDNKNAWKISLDIVSPRGATMVGAEVKFLKITFPRMAKNAFFTVLFKHLDLQNNVGLNQPFLDDLWE